MVTELSRAKELRLMAELARELAKKFDMTAAGEWPFPRLKAFADQVLPALSNAMSARGRHSLGYRTARGSKEDRLGTGVENLHPSK